jgi:RNA polymerase sigma-54 factor
MKPALQLRLSQHLALTPQLQQSIKLLQLSTVEMQQEIERYLLENPMLERDDEHGGEAFTSAQQFDSPRNQEGERRSSASSARKDARDVREQERSIDALRCR